MKLSTFHSLYRPTNCTHLGKERIQYVQQQTKKEEKRVPFRYSDFKSLVKNTDKTNNQTREFTLLSTKIDSISENVKWFFVSDCEHSHTYDSL